MNRLLCSVLSAWLVGMSLQVFAQEKDLRSGLVMDKGFEVVRGHCGTCHSLRLVTQNRADRDGWIQMIRWMQDTQGLWPLGADETIILDYLSKHYGPVRSGRRKPLPPIE